MDKNLNTSLINKALGIEEEAGFEVTLNAIMQLKEQKGDLNNFVPKADYEVVLNSRDELQAKLQAIELNTIKTEANTLIDEAVKNGQISENSRDFYLELCSNKDGLTKVAEHLVEKPKLSNNIHANKENKRVATNSLSAEEIAVGKKMGHSVEELQKAKTVRELISQE